MFVSLVLAALLTQATGEHKHEHAGDAAPAQSGADGAPKPLANEVFTSKEKAGITIKYVDLVERDADALLGTLITARDVIHLGLGVSVPFDPIVTLKERSGARRSYWTDGDDKVFFDFPSGTYYRAMQPDDGRILKLALPAFVQLWLYRSLSTTAGLDPRILDSLAEYAHYVYRVKHSPTSAGGPPGRAVLVEPPPGPGMVWYHLEQVYPGHTAFILNTLSARKVAGHQLGAFFRDTAFNATEDPQVRRLFDLVSPPVPLLADEDVEPSAPLQPTTTMRRSRVRLFNGTALLDATGDTIPPADRVNDFDMVFDTAARIVPDSAVQAEPPMVAGLDLWKLYFEFRPRVARARDNIDYYLVLRELLGRFRDRSLGFRSSETFPVPAATPLWTHVPGLSFTEIDGRVFISKVKPESEPAKVGLHAGLEVVTVDGRPAPEVVNLLADIVQVFDSCPSVQRARVFAMQWLLSGAQESEVAVELRDPAAAADAPVRSLTLKRALPSSSGAATSAVELQVRPDQIAVVRVTAFFGNSLQRFAAAVEDLTKQGAKGLIIDLRGNEGARDPRNPGPAGLSALARLLPPDQPRISVGTEVSREPTNFASVKLGEVFLQPAPGAVVFNGPVAVLIDAWTGGEAEIFAYSFSLAKRGKLLGSRSAGSTTLFKKFEPFQALAKSRIDLNFPRTSFQKPTGERLQTVGLAPEIEVTENPADLKAGRDTALERAAELLLGQL